MDRQVQSGKKTVFLICFFIKYETKLVDVEFLFITHIGLKIVQLGIAGYVQKFQKLILFCGRQKRTVQILLIALFGTDLEIYILTYLPR